MDLDMYGIAVYGDSAEDIDAIFDSDVDCNAALELASTKGLDVCGDFFYWRKHPNLHGWMEKLYREKGGTAESFNCVAVRLRSEDLDKLEAEINQLPETEGFFFGVSTPEDHELDLEFIKKARNAIARGGAVFYDSWW